MYKRQISHGFGKILSNEIIPLRFCTGILYDNDLLNGFALATCSMVRHLEYVFAIKCCNNAYKGIYNLPYNFTI